MTMADGAPAEPGRAPRDAPGCDPMFDPETILFHGSGLLIVDKPAGIPVHRGTSHPTGVAEMVEQWVTLNPRVLDLRPGARVRPAHRLDREASGVLILGLTAAAAREVQAAFTARRIRKRYLAFVAGPVEAMGHLDGRARSKVRGIYRSHRVELTYRRIRGDARLSLVEAMPEGGRTHQIRELFAQAGRPLAGDLRYGRPKPSRGFLEKFGVPSFLLHAGELTLPPGIIGGERVFRAPIPETFRRVVAEKGWPALQEE